MKQLTDRADPREVPLVCAECGRLPRQDENADDEWRAYRDIHDGPAGVLPGVRRARVRHRRSARLDAGPNADELALGV
jgi:hypothetical protein